MLLGIFRIGYSRSISIQGSGCLGLLYRYRGEGRFAIGSWTGTFGVGPVQRRLETKSIQVVSAQARAIAGGGGQGLCRAAAEPWTRYRTVSTKGRRSKVGGLEKKSGGCGCCGLEGGAAVTKRASNGQHLPPNSPPMLRRADWLQFAKERFPFPLMISLGSAPCFPPMKAWHWHVVHPKEDIVELATVRIHAI